MRISIDMITRITAAYYGLTVAEVKSRKRAMRFARPRQIAMYLCREHLNVRGYKNSTPEIGRRMGGRDHSTVLHSCRRVDEIQAEDAKIAHDVEALRSRILLEASDFPPFKSAAQSAIVFISSASPQPFRALDNLASRALSAPGHSFSQVRPVNGLRPITTRADGHSTKSAPALAVYRAGGPI